MIASRLHRARRTLRQRLLFFLLTPLSVLLCLSLVADYRIAFEPAAEAYDHALADDAVALAGRIRYLDARLQVDLRRDVALLTAEGNQWFSRGKSFAAGRTASRIQQALGWLGQLKLIDAGGITADGDVVLKRAFAVLAEEAAA